MGIEKTGRPGGGGILLGNVVTPVNERGDRETSNGEPVRSSEVGDDNLGEGGGNNGVQRTFYRGVCASV